jgi:O-antigen biosynthesis protein
MRMRQNLIEAAYVHFLGAARRQPQSKRIKELLAEVMRIRRPAQAEAQAPVQPSGPDYPLTSIVIPTHNQLELTKLCVESIRQYTGQPHELIFVDNASTDGTLEYLESLCAATIIRNASNRGFPAAANQGIGAAKGEQILLLNNDTIVTTGWLRRLLDAFRSDDLIGLAGPCSNCVGGEQQVTAVYSDLSGIDGFARKWGELNQNRRIDTDRLVGFCLLIRRTVVERIGMLDEQFGLGTFEDDDYCRRALEAGFRAVIACDAFVHHFGGQTFLSLGVDYGALLKNNLELFEKKWPHFREKKVSGPFFVRAIATTTGPTEVTTRIRPSATPKP